MTKSERVSTTGATLRAARLELEWTQTRAILALVQQAERDGIPVADRTSLKTMFSRWENGKRQPDPVYQRLLCRIYGRDEDELGFTQEPLKAASALRVAPAVSDTTVEYFRNVFREHVKADNLMGPHHLVDVVRAQVALLDQVIPAAQGRHRRKLLHLAYQYTEFTGWLYQDAGLPDSAMTFTDRAMDYALELDDPLDCAYVLMRKSNIACDLGKPDRAIGLTKAAYRNARGLSPRVRSLILVQQGRAHAVLGNADDHDRVIDQALNEVTRPATSSYSAAAYCNESYVAMEAAASLTALGRYHEAIPVFERSLRQWPEHLRRDKGLCLARLANAYAAAEDIDNAAATGRAALDVVHAATSGRALMELMRLRRHLAPRRRDAQVSDLCEHVQALTSAAR